MRFQSKLKELRLKSGLLQRQIASAIGIDSAIYCKLEKGDRLASETQVRALADLYRIDYKEFRRLWVAEKLYDILEEENEAHEILNIVAESIVEYGKCNSNKEGI